jgi:DnaJ-class molecular chaperone
MRDADYVCKHCGVLGEECLTCNGEGEVDDLETSELCPACDGEGVRTSYHFEL